MVKLYSDPHGDKIFSINNSGGMKSAGSVMSSDTKVLVLEGKVKELERRIQTSKIVRKTICWVLQYYYIAYIIIITKAVVG